MLWWTLRKLKGSSRTRLKAIKSLGLSADRRAVGPLVNIVQESWLKEGERLEAGIRVQDRHIEAQGHEKRAAVEALGDLGDPAAVPTLVAALGDPALNGAAADALKRLGHDPRPELAAKVKVDAGARQLEAESSGGVASVRPGAAASVGKVSSAISAPAALAGVRSPSPPLTTIEECRRWLADYQRRADIAGAKFDDMTGYIKCIKAVGEIGTPEAIGVLEEVRSGAMFTEILEAAIAAINQAKFGAESPAAGCARYLAQQETWATTFAGKAVEDHEFYGCINTLKTLKTEEAVGVLRRIAESDAVFPNTRKAARTAIGMEEPQAKEGAPTLRSSSDGPTFTDVEQFLIEAKSVLGKFPIRDRGVILEQFWHNHHQLPQPVEGQTIEDVIQHVRQWASKTREWGNGQKGHPTFNYFRIDYSINPTWENGGSVQLCAFLEGPYGPTFTDCKARPARDRWYFWY